MVVQLVDGGLREDLCPAVNVFRLMMMNAARALDALPSGIIWIVFDPQQSVVDQTVV